MQISRLFQVVYILLEKGTVTAAELAERFEVSVRTIYRDVEALSQAGKVLDEGKEWVGKATIKKWSDEHHFSANVTIDPQKDRQHEAETMVVFKVDGDFDKTGLPDPLYLEFYFQIRNHKIKRLAIQLSEGPEPGAYQASSNRSAEHERED